MEIFESMDPGLDPGMDKTVQKVKVEFSIVRETRELIDLDS